MDSLKLKENKYFKVELNTEITNKVWHDAVYINSDKYTFKLQETIMGCGIAQLYGISNLTYMSKNEREELKDILQNQITNLESLGIDNYKCMKVGLIIATLGDMYRSNNEKHLLELGFTELSSYSNWRHREDGTEIQKLYGLKTNYNGITNKG